MGQTAWQLQSSYSITRDLPFDSVRSRSNGWFRHGVTQSVVGVRLIENYHQLLQSRRMIRDQLMRKRAMLRYEILAMEKLVEDLGNSIAVAKR
jgi:hypothetical protein